MSGILRGKRLIPSRIVAISPAGRRDRHARLRRRHHQRRLRERRRRRAQRLRRESRHHRHRRHHAPRRRKGARWERSCRHPGLRRSRQSRLPGRRRHCVGRHCVGFRSAGFHSAGSHCAGLRSAAAPNHAAPIAGASQILPIRRGCHFLRRELHRRRGRWIPGPSLSRRNRRVRRSAGSHQSNSAPRRHESASRSPGCVG
jgi:hypothetical protein